MIHTDLHTLRLFSRDTRQKQPSTDTMGPQLYYWAQAALSCGVGRTAEARAYIRNVLQFSDSRGDPATTMWLVPCVAYILVETDPAKAIELLAWVYTYPDTALHWARQWPLLDRLQGQLQAALDGEMYRIHWEIGQKRTLSSIMTELHQALRVAPAASAEAARGPLLTAREQEILGLIAAGMTNPQIAAQLVIGSGTVKTHTLNIYRKLEVANRTQAIVRAQEFGILHT